MPAPSRPAAVPARRLRRFRVDVGTLVLLIVLVQALLLLGLGYWGAQRLVGTFGDSAHRANHLRVEDRINAFLERAVAAIEAAANAPGLAPAGPLAGPSAELLWTLLLQRPELDSLYAADQDGRMLMVLRYPEPAVRHIQPQHGSTLETWEYKPARNDGADPQARYQTQRVSTVHSLYDPRKRPWFQEVSQSDLPAWTTPYVFAKAQELGVTHAMPRPAGKEAEPLTGPLIVAGDVSLSRLSEFVRQFSRTAGFGESVLLSQSGEILARSDRPGHPRQLERPDAGVLGALYRHLQDAAPAPGALEQAFGIDVEGRRYLVRSSPIPSTLWQLVSWVPEEELLGSLRRSMSWALLLALLCLGLAVAAALHLARRVTAPIERLSATARRIGRLELDELPRVNSRVLEIQQLDQALDESARGLEAFRRFVPVDVMRQLVAAGRALEPGGEPREITVMFTDIRGFTGVAEASAPDALVAQLTEYFNAAAEVIARHGGTIDKFIGDGIMILWGAPTALPDAALHACRAALALQRALAALNARWRAQGRVEFDTCIGIHSGPAVVGVLGAKDRLAYTALGDTVNVASRLEGLNRTLGTRVLVSETTADALAGRLPLRCVDTVELRGRQRPLMVYELLPRPAQAGASSGPARAGARA